METSDLKSLLIDYIDGSLDEIHKDWVKEKIKSDKQVAREYEELKELIGVIGKHNIQKPDKSLEDGFLSMLDDELIALEDSLAELENGVNNGQVKVIGLKLSGAWKIAATVALIAIGTLFGMYIVNRNNTDQIAILTKDVSATKKMVIDALENETSPSNRIKGVNASLNIIEPDDEILTALIHTMETDHNTNVRLAAIEALFNFIDEPNVKRVFIEGLENQKDPIIQITLINILVKIREKGALKNMQKIIEDSGSLNTVKDEAQLGIYKLS